MKKILILILLCLPLGAAYSQDNIEKSSDFTTGYIKGSYPYTFGTIDGVLYVFLGQDPFILVKYPSSDLRESFTIPNTVSRIARGAFMGARNLKELIIPYSVKYIGENAFDDTDIEKFTVSGNDVSAHFNAINEQDAGGVTYYDISGIPHPTPQTGVNIKMEGGSATKVIAK